MQIYESDDQKSEQVIIVSESNFVYRIPLRKGEDEDKMEESIVLAKN